MKVKTLKDGIGRIVPDAYGMRLCEQGRAVPLFDAKEAIDRKAVNTKADESDKKGAKKD